MLEDPVDGYILGFSLRPLRISAVCVEIAFLPQSIPACLRHADNDMKLSKRRKIRAFSTSF
jgi:hypothetical protein